MKGIVIFLTLLLIGVGDASSQSLAEVAKKEKERREALGSTKAESYDDSTLAERRRAMPPSTLLTGVAGGAIGATEASGEDEEGQDTELVDEEDPTQTQAY